MSDDQIGFLAKTLQSSPSFAQRFELSPQTASESSATASSPTNAVLRITTTEEKAPISNEMAPPRKRFHTAFSDAEVAVAATNANSSPKAKDFSKRAEQNRLAQRNFRERKERYICTLEERSRDFERTKQEMATLTGKYNELCNAYQAVLAENDTLHQTMKHMAHAAADATDDSDEASAAHFIDATAAAADWLPLKQAVTASAVPTPDAGDAWGGAAISGSAVSAVSAAAVPSLVNAQPFSATFAEDIDVFAMLADCAKPRPSYITDLDPSLFPFVSPVFADDSTPTLVL